MKKLGRIHKLGLAGLSALALATPVALAQTAGGEQGQTQRAERRGNGDVRGGRHGRRGGKRGGEFGRGGRHFGALRGIELTDAQKASMKQLRGAFGERTKSLRERDGRCDGQRRQAGEGDCLYPSEFLHDYFSAPSLPCLLP